MNFAIRNLSVLAYAQGFTLWHYKAPTGTLAQATAPGFFNPAAFLIAAGDMILVSAVGAGTILFVTSASEANGVQTGSLA